MHNTLCYEQFVISEFVPILQFGRAASRARCFAAQFTHIAFTFKSPSFTIYRAVLKLEPFVSLRTILQLVFAQDITMFTIKAGYANDIEIKSLSKRSGDSSRTFRTLPS